MKKFYYLILFLTISFAGISQNLELPAINTNDEIIYHSGFTLSYNEKHEQANWVAYDLTAEETVKAFERSNKFLIDPKVKNGSANDADYKGTGYDRGHLAPAADMSYTLTTMQESFYYSNMSPQNPGFNRGIWKNLEALVRGWAIEYDTIYVVTGPVLKSGLQVIGPNKVSVPKQYYKVILKKTENGYQGIGFILPNSPSQNPLKKYVVSIDSVEKATGIDFYPLLEDTIESMIESNYCINCWSFQVQKSQTNTTNTSPKTNQNVSSGTQCKGITTDGDQCKNSTTNPSGYCYIHETRHDASNNDNRRSTSVQCSGTTKKGARCKRMTLSPNGRCFQHGGN